MSFTDSTETLVLNWLLTAGVATRPAAWHVGLFTTAPTEAGGGTEVSGGSYARRPATFSVTGNTASNTANVEFAVASASWGNITHAAIMSAASGGTMLAYGTLTNAKTIANGDVFRIPTGDFKVTLD